MTCQQSVPDLPAIAPNKMRASADTNDASVSSLASFVSQAALFQILHQSFQDWPEQSPLVVVQPFPRDQPGVLQSPLVLMTSSLKNWTISATAL